MAAILITKSMTDRLDLLAAPVGTFVTTWRDPTSTEAFGVAEIDPSLADTEAFCAHYNVSPGESANCVIVHARRGQDSQYVACVVLSTTKVDVNGFVRRHVGARRASFAAMADAVARTGMEYGGITPLGLPPEWPILIDRAVTETVRVWIGSGLRRSKLLVPGAELAHLPKATVHDEVAIAV